MLGVCEEGLEQYEVKICPFEMQNFYIWDKYLLCMQTINLLCEQLLLQLRWAQLNIFNWYKFAISTFSLFLA